MVNVRDYDVAGRGFPAAMAAAIAATGPGGEVVVPAGTYAATVEVPLNVDRLRVTFDPGATVERGFDTTNRALFRVTGDHVQVHGARLDGKKAVYASTGYGILVESGAAVSLTNIEAFDCYESGIVVAGGTDASVLNSWSHDNGVSSNAAAGIYVNNSPRARIANNLCEGNGITGDSLRFDGDGIKIQGSADTSTGAVITGNVCRNNARRGVKVQNSNCTISGNHLTGNWSSGVGITSSINVNYGACLVAGNTLVGNLTGISVDNARGFAIHGNKIEGCVGTYGNGIQVLAGTSEFDVSDNMIRGQWGNGIYVTAGVDGVIERNKVYNCGQGLYSSHRCGIRLVAGAGLISDVRVKGNLIANTQGGTSMYFGVRAEGSAVRTVLDRNDYYSIATPGTNSESLSGAGVTSLSKIVNGVLS